MAKDKEKQSRRKLSMDLAIALQHDMGMKAAPRVIAKAQGLLAHRMIEEAQINQIPIHKDQHLAQVLKDVEVEDEIPVELYEAVAQVLAFIYRVDKDLRLQ